MRILHTSDWHLGRTLEGRSRLPEQEAFLNELCAIAEDTAARLILIAGDVFDTVNPPAAAEELFYDAVSRLSANGQRLVFIIAGNHDNPERLCAAAPLAGKQSIILLGKPGETPMLSSTAKASDAVQLLANGPGWCDARIDDERVQVVSLPYPSEARLDTALVENVNVETELRAAYSERVQQILAQGAACYTPNAIRLAISHLFVAGGIESESERPIQVGGAFTVSAQAFPGNAQYVALGHLHRAQRVHAAPGHVRYSGTPLAYSFAEAGQAKSVTLLDATPTTITTEEIPLSAGKPLVRWRATQGLAEVEEWCQAGRDSNAWVDLEIHLVASLTLEEIAQLKRMHPGLISIHPVFAAQDQVAATAEEREGLPIEELFQLFYRQRNDGATPPTETVQLFLELLQKAQETSDSE
jgi:exonuclease SbcD